MSFLQVILLRDLPKLGKLGDVVRVKRGHARNYLLPSGRAQTYSKANWTYFESRKSDLIAEQNNLRSELERLHGDLDGYLLQEVMHASEDGHLYGSITPALVVDLLQKQNHSIKSHQIMLPNDEPIKQIGEHEIQIKVAPDLVATLRLSVLGDT